MDKHASVHISCYTEREGPRGFSFFAGACLAPSSAAAAMREPRLQLQADGLPDRWGWQTGDRAERVKGWGLNI
jgi:hypothetical protein